jgi:hypothetical protein
MGEVSEFLTFHLFSVWDLEISISRQQRAIWLRFSFFFLDTDLQD